MKPFFIFFVKVFLLPLISLFIKEIEGRENLSTKGPFILASNHINGWDHFFISFFLKEKLKDVHFVGAMESLKIHLLFKPLYWASDTITINRNRLKREDFLNRLQKYLNRAKIIIIYPEGDTNPREVLLRGKTGVAELALRTEAKVVPLGMRKIKNSLRRIIKIGKPIDFKEEKRLLKERIQNSKDYRLLLRRTTDKIMQEISKLSGKRYPYK